MRTLLVILSLVLLTSPAQARHKRWKVPFVNPKYYRPASKHFRDRKCLRMLRSLKVRFRKLKNVKGVATPVKILGYRLGRTHYKPRYKAKTPMIMDCRLALSLYRASELFRINNIKTLVFSNFYSWRHVKGSGRLSRHALGLAADIHAFIDKHGRYLDVTKHYERGLGRGKTCAGHAKTYRARVLRDLACDLDASNLFETVLTPDYDKGHHNHFHIGVFHPQDPKRYRLFRTVLMEVRGRMYKWVWSRPRRGFFSSRRLRRVVKARWRARRRWYRWKRNHKKRSHNKRHPRRRHRPRRHRRH